jgi:hypothetical protein
MATRTPTILWMRCCVLDTVRLASLARFLAWGVQRGIRQVPKPTGQTWRTTPHNMALDMDHAADTTVVQTALGDSRFHQPASPPCGGEAGGSPCKASATPTTPGRKTSEYQRAAVPQTPSTIRTYVRTYLVLRTYVTISTARSARRAHCLARYTGESPSELDTAWLKHRT